MRNLLYLTWHRGRFSSVGKLYKLRVALISFECHGLYAKPGDSEHWCKPSLLLIATALFAPEPLARPKCPSPRLFSVDSHLEREPSPAQSTVKVMCSLSTDFAVVNLLPLVVRQARGQKRRLGWFPANYVKLLTASASASPDLSHAATSPRPQSAVRPCLW